MRCPQQVLLHVSLVQYAVSKRGDRTYGMPRVGSESCGGSCDDCATYLVLYIVPRKLQIRRMNVACVTLYINPLPQLHIVTYHERFLQHS